MIKANLDKVRARIAAAAKEGGQNPEDIVLIAVTKTHPAEVINEALSLGVTHIGENRPQEVRDKFPLVEGKANWHLIGQLQTNKIKYIIDKVCMIHSVDSVRLMDEIDRHAQKHDLVMDILIQVNISGEETKSGIAPDELSDILTHAGELSNIRVRGLMTIAPNAEDAIVEKCFSDMSILYKQTAQKTYKNVTMDYLSMGMSGDYEKAIKHGANMVRVGRSIFGAREYAK